MNEKNWYEINNVDRLDTPALVVYPEKVRHNIREAMKLVPAVENFRPHIKTHKSSVVVRMLMDEGISKFKCATIAEAELLGLTGAPDVLLAYQPTGPKADRLVSLIRRFPATTFSCLIDNWDVANELNEKMLRIRHCLPVYIDLNVGMNRTGISPGDDARRLYQQAINLEGILPVGLHAYDGHIRETDLGQRKTACDASFAAVKQLQEALEADEYETPQIVAGGSPTFAIHAQRKDVECSPGTFVYWDLGYALQLPEFSFVYAALLVTRVISLPAAHLICTDLGHKAVAAENPLNKRIRFLNAPDLEPVSQSEEHLVLKTEGTHPYKVGDVLYGVPYHICPTVALHDRMIAIEKHQVSGEWPVEARTRMITI